MTQHLEYIRHQRTERPSIYESFLHGFSGELGASAIIITEGLVREQATRTAIRLLIAQSPNPTQAGIDEYQKFNTLRNELMDGRNVEREAQQ